MESLGLLVLILLFGIIGLFGLLEALFLLNGDDSHWIITLLQFCIGVSAGWFIAKYIFSLIGG